MQWTCRGLLLLVLACGLELTGQAAPKLLLQDLVGRTWTREEGLPDNSVTAVLQARDGYLWVGTLGGLARFDGVRFLAMAPPAAVSNEALRVTSLCEDSAGQLWIGTQGAGLLRCSGGRESRFEGNTNLSDQIITGIAEDTTGALWVGTPLGLNRLRGSQVARFTVKEGLPSDFVSSVHVARSGTVWITTSAGMCQYRDGHVSPFPFETDGAGRNPLYLGVYEDRQGNQWAFGDTYLVRLDKLLGEGKRLNYFHSSDTSSVRLWSLCEGRNGQLWVGASGQGLYCFADDKLIPLTLRAGRLSSDVRTMFEDREGNLWLGTHDAGLVRLQPRSVRVLDASLGLPPSRASSLAFGPEGRLWVGFESGGLYGGAAERFEPDSAGNELGLRNLVSSLCVSPDTGLWVGTAGTGLYCVSGQRALHYTTVDGLSDNAILALAAEPGGTVWIGTSSGLHCFINGVLSGFGTNAGLPEEPFSALLPARGGGLWLGTTGGAVLRRENGRFRQFEDADSLRGSAILALYEDLRGRLWVGTAGGNLACVSAGRCQRLELNPGAASDPITGILGNDAGDLCFATTRAIRHFNEAEIEQWLSGRAAPRPEFLFEGEVPVGSVSSYGWPRALSSPDGRFWFATANGVVTFDPRGLEPASAPPPVCLEAILVNGRPADSGPIKANDAATLVRLPSDLRSLEFQFTAFCFSAPDKLRFRHKLEGLDADWVDGGTERRVRYGRLPYGAYKFRVTACNTAGIWNPAGAAFAFIVPAPAWRTGWALALYGCGVLGLVAGGARLVSYRRLRRHLAHLAQEQAMQRERMRIAQDMHDEIGSKLTKISFMSERAKGELQGQEAVANRLNAIAHTSRDLLQSLDEIVWAVNPRNDTLEHLAAYLGQYATEYLQNTSVECELHIPRGLPHQPLSAETRHNLFLAFEEALNNALKHGQPSRVKVTMAVERARFEIAVEDNGRGFDSAMNGRLTGAAIGARPQGGGNGLWNMRQRLTDVGGECVISSQPGHGAYVRLSILLGAARKIL